jgi:putative aldouronate transport system permease protein
MNKKVPLKERSIKNIRHVKRNWDLYLLALPGLLWYCLFDYKPMVGLRIAFYKYNAFLGIKGSKFIGFDNFITFLTGNDFLRVFVNTITISLLQIVICFPLAIILAICVTEMKSKNLSKAVQSATLLPHFISVVVVCGMVINFCSPSTGIFNLVLMKLGLKPIYFMVLPQYFKGIYTTMTLWQNAGFNSLVYIAAIMGISPELYEAATLDGAGKIQRILHITVPSILPTIVTMLVLNIGKMVKVGYEAIILLYQPSTYSSADVISTYAYRLGFEQANYGLSTAVGLFEGFIAFVFVVAANKISKKLTETALW